MQKSNFIYIQAIRIRTLKIDKTNYFWTYYY